MKTTSEKAAAREPYEPTAKDIRQQCELIQAGWSARERKRRAGQLGQSSWVPPSVDWMTVADALNEDGAAAINPSESPW